MTPHYEDSNIVIHKIKCGPYDNNAYLLICPRTNESIIIDTPEDPDQLVRMVADTKVKAVLITHNHLDHIRGITEVTSVIKAPVGVGEDDAGALPRPPDFFLTDGDQIRAGTVSLTVISTPGHTPGSICLVTGKRLFTGDTLFPGGPGKTKTHENFSEIIHSITSKLFVLGDDLTFYPGHGEDADLRTAKEEYDIFVSKDRNGVLCGDVQWLKS